MQIPPKPFLFDGTVEELWRAWIKPALPDPAAVDQFDRWLFKYCSENSAVFPVRQVRGCERGTTCQTCDGTRIVPADNSPAWAVHTALVEDRLSGYNQFRRFMLEIPAHMFAFQRVIGARAAPRGYYFAHVFPAKNRDIAFRTWPRSEVVRRFYLTLHPCNFFLVPGGRTLGEDPKLIRFVASLYCRRYAPTWRKFLERTGASAASLGTPDPNDVVHSGATRAKSGEPRGAPLPGHVRHSSRLCFKRDVIEPLAWDQPFEVVTRFGTYRFTKRQFYEAFPNIPATRSYREQGRYHGAKLHLKAERFRVPRTAAAADSQQ